MAKLRLKNETDETIELEPGESIDVRGEEKMVRLMSERSVHFQISESEPK